MSWLQDLLAGRQAAATAPPAPRAQHELEPEDSTPDWLRFRGLLSAMRFLDHDVLERAGVVFDWSDWIEYRTNPVRFFLRLEDDRAARMFALIVRNRHLIAEDTHP